MPTPQSAAISSAGRHPIASASGGNAAPANAAPPGTPVCLIEKTSAMRPGGAVRASTSEEAGVMAPYPRPITMGATANSRTADGGSNATNAIPAAQISTHSCETRIAPWRAMKYPEARLAVIEPT